MTNFQAKVKLEYAKLRAKGYEARDALREARWKMRSVDKWDAVLDNKWGYYSKISRKLPNGWKLRVEITRDEDARAPWKEYDGHGVVVEGRGRGWCPDEFEDWKLLDEPWNTGFYYDWKESLKIALRDGWGCPGNFRTPHERAMAAVKADYEHLHRWCNDQWWYTVIGVRITTSSGVELCEDYLGGVETSDEAYFICTVREFVAQNIWATYRDSTNRAMKKALDTDSEGGDCD